MTLLGGGYLVYLGARIFFSASRPVDIATGDARPRCNALLLGCLVTRTNPKAVVLFPSEWDRQYCLRQNPDHQLLDFA